MERKYLFIFFITLALIHNNCAQKCPRQCICDMRNDLRRASCNNRNIVDVNVGVPKDVQIYILKGNVINEVENFAFRDLQYISLVQLDLSNNKIFWIGLHAFAGLDKLRIINLSTNRLQSLSSDVFWYNKDLESLDLSGNQFTHIKNEPFLGHSNLKVLNLSNSQIAFIPEQTFTKLPGLSVLDLSNNNMIELKISIFLPINHLKKINLKDNRWHCTADFSKLEEWITRKQIRYEKQCYAGNADKPHMFEKMMMTTAEIPDEKEVDVNELWNLDYVEVTPNSTSNNPNVPLSFYDRFEERFPSIWALIVGFQLGLILGIVVTYFWLADLCKCRTITCAIPRSRRQLRRARNIEETETRSSLLWTTIINANTDTPPIMRRQLSNSTNRGAYCRSSSWEILPTIDNTCRIPSSSAPPNEDRAETPPPPYQQCASNN